MSTGNAPLRVDRGLGALRGVHYEHHSHVLVRPAARRSTGSSCRQPSLAATEADLRRRGCRIGWTITALPEGIAPLARPAKEVAS